MLSFLFKSIFIISNIVISASYSKTIITIDAIDFRPNDLFTIQRADNVIYTGKNKGTDLVQYNFISLPYGNYNIKMIAYNKNLLDTANLLILLFLKRGAK